jgi:hypothetical protein
MWILPCGYGFATQACSIGNDELGAVYALAALVFAFRARSTGEFRDAAFSLLAIGLATGVKVSNVPLLLPCLFALWPARGLFGRRPAATCAVLALAAAVSFLPTAVLNYHATGSPLALTPETKGLEIANPAAGFAANTLKLVIENLAPPIMPWATRANAAFEHFIPIMLPRLNAAYARFHLKWGELPGEESAGLGLGIAILLAVAAWQALRHRGSASGLTAQRAAATRPVLLAGLCALIVLLAKAGSTSINRLALPYFPLVVLAFLRAPAGARLVRSRAWRRTALLCCASILPSLLLSPSHPLLPALRITTWLRARAPASPLLQRMETVYQVYSARHDSLRELREFIPVRVREIGFLGGADDSELSLWQPVGTHRVISILSVDRDSPEFQRLRGGYVVLSATALTERFELSMPEFLHATGAQIVGSARVTLKAAQGPEDWYVVKLASREE